MPSLMTKKIVSCKQKEILGLVFMRNRIISNIGVVLTMCWTVLKSNFHVLLQPYKVSAIIISHFILKMGVSVLPRLVLNLWTQVIHLL